MERPTDKLIIAACCCLALLFTVPSTVTVVGALLAITVTALYEAYHAGGRVPVATAAEPFAPPVSARIAAAAPFIFVLIAALYPAFAAFLPLAAYDCLREEGWLRRLAWLVALPSTLFTWTTPGALAVCISCALACLLSLRTTALLRERADARRKRDDLQEATLSIEARNRDLQASQDLQVRLATLTERGRIAREIHDNVGHLLTRAIMQTEAMQVVHAGDPRVKADFGDIGSTLHEAMDEVRASVHDLRDESIDMVGRLQEALDGCGIEHADLEYQVEEMPANVGYGFLAVVREALSNTVRHSDASHVEVSVVEHPGLFQLSVRDDGSRPPAPTYGSGMGLATMEGRVRAMGGTFRTEYRDGFRVFASVPKVRGDARIAAVSDEGGEVEVS